MIIFVGTVDYYRRYRPGIHGTVAEILDQAVAPGHPRLAYLYPASFAVFGDRLGEFE